MTKNVHILFKDKTEYTRLTEQNEKGFDAFSFYFDFILLPLLRKMMVANTYLLARNIKLLGN